MKTPSVVSKNKLITILSVVSFICLSCAERRLALEQISRADQAVLQASQKEASKFAALEINMAATKLEEAKKANAEGDYEIASRLAEQSLVNAELAEAKTASAKAENIAEETRKGIETLHEETNRHRRIINRHKED